RSLVEGGLNALGGASEVGASVQGSATGLAMAARGILSQVDARVIDSLPGISVPTLIIVGDGDTYYLQGSDYMPAAFPAPSISGLRTPAMASISISRKW
ncbi:MAG: hypothetical protein QF384_18285, partial [Alphaproteobacteria bacterium]|nr:hypothetical protein [Alphaproteobacteria bacterium]